jgi:hypothetical protein
MSTQNQTPKTRPTRYMPVRLLFPRTGTSDGVVPISNSESPVYESVFDDFAVVDIRVKLTRLLMSVLSLQRLSRFEDT